MSHFVVLSATTPRLPSFPPPRAATKPPFSLVFVGVTLEKGVVWDVPVPLQNAPSPCELYISLGNGVGSERSPGTVPGKSYHCFPQDLRDGESGCANELHPAPSHRHQHQQRQSV